MFSYDGLLYGAYPGGFDPRYPDDLSYDEFGGCWFHIWNDSWHTFQVCVQHSEIILRNKIIIFSFKFLAYVLTYFFPLVIHQTVAMQLVPLLRPNFLGFIIHQTVAMQLLSFLRCCSLTIHVINYFEIQWERKRRKVDKAGIWHHGTGSRYNYGCWGRWEYGVGCVQCWWSSSIWGGILNYLNSFLKWRS